MCRAIALSSVYRLQLLSLLDRFYRRHVFNTYLSVSMRSDFYTCKVSLECSCVPRSVGIILGLEDLTPPVIRMHRCWIQHAGNGRRSERPTFLSRRLFRPVQQP